MSAFGSAVVEVAIGLAFMYLLLSLVVTVINELIAQAFALRARTLEQGLVQLLQGDGDTSGANNLWQRFRSLTRHKRPNSGPTPALAAPDAALDRGRLAGGPSLTDDVAQADASPGSRQAPTAAALLRHPLIISLSPRNETPSHIPVRQFALVLLDIIAPDLDPTDGDYVGKLRRVVGDIQDSHSRKTLLALIDKSSRNVEDVRARIESWFNDAMDRVSGWYKRKITTIGLFVGLVLTLLLNADSLGVAQMLWTNPSTRSAVASAAQEFVSKQATPTPVAAGSTASATAAQATPTPGSFQTDTQMLSNEVATIESSQLPLGWGAFPPVGRDQLRELMGLLLTTLAISLGAPFWFDVLSMFVSVKTTGPVNTSSSNSLATTPSSSVVARISAVPTALAPATPAVADGPAAPLVPPGRP